MNQGPSAQAPLIVSISGIRGIVGESLTPQVACDFAACYGSGLAGQRVVVSRDGRRTGPMLRDAVVAGLLSVGRQVVDIGIAATPTCGFYVRSIGAAGGVQITASHNPAPYNGLKLFRPEGFVLSPQAGQKVADDYRARRIQFVGHERILAVETVADPHEAHLDRVLSLVDVEAIRRRRFRVVLDANHGSGAVFGPRLLDRLGCRVEVLGGAADGDFEHPPEPTAENLADLGAAVLRADSAVGFAVDPDADRLALADEQGRYIGEEYTLALAIRRRAAQTKGPVVINSSTSLISEDAARAAGCPVYRTPVGEVHVAERMREVGAIIGGEGNGGVIDPRVGFGRDSAVAMALVLDLLAAEQRPLSDLVRQMPAYAIHKDRVTIDRARLGELFVRIKSQFRDAAVDESDGLRIAWDDGWLQVRASNTEPLVRIIAEARRADRAQDLCRQTRALLDKR